jgi:hypothetical protein
MVLAQLLGEHPPAASMFWSSVFASLPLLRAGEGRGALLIMLLRKLIVAGKPQC